MREARRRAALTQSQLAARAGTTQSAVARLESGRTSPSFDTVVRLVRLCGFRLDVALEAYDDTDVAQAEALLRLSVDERVDHVLSAVAFAHELRDAHRAADAR